MTDLHDRSATGTIRVEAEGPATCVRLVGEIDSALRQQASDCMGLVLLAGLPVVVDGSLTTFIDSSGLAFVLQLNRAVGEAGLDLRLRDPGRVLTQALEMIGMAGAIPPEA